MLQEYSLRTDTKERMGPDATPATLLATATLLHVVTIVSSSKSVLPKKDRCFSLLCLYWNIVTSYLLMSFPIKFSGADWVWQAAAHIYTPTYRKTVKNASDHTPTIVQCRIGY